MPEFIYERRQEPEVRCLSCGTIYDETLYFPENKSGLCKDCIRESDGYEEDLEEHDNL